MPSRSILIRSHRSLPRSKLIRVRLPQDTVAGNTALHLAAADGHLEVVKVLAKALSPEELGALNDRGINALMVTRTIIPEVLSCVDRIIHPHEHSSRSELRG